MYDARPSPVSIYLSFSYATQSPRASLAGRPRQTTTGTTSTTPTTTTAWLCANFPQPLLTPRAAPAACHHQAAPLGVLCRIAQDLVLVDDIDGLDQMQRGQSARSTWPRGAAAALTAERKAKEYRAGGHAASSPSAASCVASGAPSTRSTIDGAGVAMSATRSRQSHG